MSSHDETARLSLNGRNAYIFLSGESDQKNITDRNYNKHYLTAKPIERARSCSPALHLYDANNMQSISPKNDCIEYSTKENTKNFNIKNNTPVLNTTTTSEINMNTQALNKPQKTNSSESASVINTNKTVSSDNGASKGAIPKDVKNVTTTKPAVLPGMLRYISINKRILSPQKKETPIKKQKLITSPLNNNRYALLSEDDNIQSVKNGNSNQKPLKPPPIFLREPSSNNLVKILIEIVGKNNFHIVPIRKGGVHETKIVIYTEEDYRKISQYLNDGKKNFYTYQLKSSKGLIVVIKGIESSVEPNDIKEALEELGYKTKVVINIFNREKTPQPMFRVELDPDDKKLKGNETHPIYSLRYLLNRRITIEEPLKRNRPVQCGNCQEFGHTRNYCTLRTVCVACGDLHSSSQCDIIQKGLKKKCGNCGGDHTANYRGCPVYKELLKRLRERRQPKRDGFFVPSAVNMDFPTPVNSVARNNENKNSTTMNANFPQLNTAKSGTSSYAGVLKSENKQPNIPQNTGGIENLLQALTQNITSLNQNMTNIMSTMQNTIQELLRAQNQMLQILLSKK